MATKAVCVDSGIPTGGFMLVYAVLLLTDLPLQVDVFIYLFNPIVILLNSVKPLCFQTSQMRSQNKSCSLKLG